MIIPSIGISMGRIEVAVLESFQVPRNLEQVLQSVEVKATVIDQRWFSALSESQIRSYRKDQQNTIHIQ